MNKFIKSAGSVWDFLDGKKTVIGGTIVFLAGGFYALGHIDEQTFKSIAAIGASISIYGLRHAVDKLQENIKSSLKK